MKMVKLALCIIMTTVMIFSCFSVAFAADDYDHNPQVYVLGLQAANIYYEDDPEKKPHSLIADFSLLLPTLECAMKGIQYQRIFQ